MSLPVIEESVAGKHDIGMKKSHIYVLRFHHMTYRYGLWRVPSELVENLLVTSSALIFSFADFYHRIIRIVSFKESVIVCSLSYPGAESIIRIAVSSDIIIIGFVCVYDFQHFFHLSESSHAAYMRYLNRQIQFFPYIYEFLHGSEYICRVISHMSAYQLA